MILGTGLGGVGTLIDGFSTNALRGPDRISPFLIPMGIPNIGAGQIAISFGMTGPNFTTVSACATGGHALGESSEMIRRGDADVMVAGGAEAGVYEARRRRVRGDARPVDPQRRPGGRVPAVRRRTRRFRHRRGRRGRDPRGARARGGAWRARSSPSSSATARRPTRRTSRCRPRGHRGRAGGATGAREGRHWRPADIDHVNAHATSTPEGDKAELQAMRDDLRRGRRAGLDHGEQEHARAHPRRRRRDRGDRDDPVDARGLRAADASTWSTRTPLPTVSTSPRTGRRSATSGPRSATRSGSEVRTRPSSSGGGMHDRRHGSPVRAA